MRRESVLASLVLLASCSDEPAPPRTEVVAQPATTGVAHGDHSPHHGGVVLMHGDLHFEVILDPEGRHQIYLTDAVRAELPAAVASDVRITVLRPGEAPPEPLTLEIDEYGESWVASGEPVPEPESRALVALTHLGEPYEVELPFLAEAPPADAPDPHAAHPR